MTETPVPFLEFCGVKNESAPEGFSRLSVIVRPEIGNTRGHAHGGLLVTMLDVALGRAARDSVPGAYSFITIDLHTSFIKPGEGRLVAEGRRTGGGRSIVFCEGEIRNATGDLVARASGVFKPVAPRPD
ncbi:MAG: thioesterase [Hyphomicrobiales bacterium]|nr:thioesterase [Hyphomicrobiales bacterium]